MTIFIDNKYTRWYYALVQKRKICVLNEGYVEKHHIIPKSLGGSDIKTNLVSLTAREHFVAHWLLTKMVTGINKSKMLLAFNMMSLDITNNKRRRTPLEFSKSRETLSIIRSDLEWKKYCSKTSKELWQDEQYYTKTINAIKIANNRPEYKTQQSKNKKQLWQDDEHRAKQTISRTKAQNRPEVIIKKSIARKLYIEKNQLTCPHCGKTCSVPMANRWHFDNCKVKTII